PVIKSSCSYHYEKMSYKSAKQSTLITPCTNIPINCPLCPFLVSGKPHTVWKYKLCL
ncbi:hypothetical protein B0H34DRAFT_641970, partial [Crassisporium funariophilum]